MENKISAFLILHNEEKLVRRALESIKGIVDEIIVVHDGKCQDRTLEICKEYTDKIFIQPRKGRASLHMIFVFKRAKYNWLLKIDADEYLSPQLKKNIRKLINNEKADAYSFIWRWYDGKKFITKEYPRKTPLFRKSKISYINFPGNDEPEIIGNTVKPDLEFIHKPDFNNFTWKTAFKKGDKRAKDQAKYTLKDFNKLEKFKYHRKDLKLSIKIRRDFPILSMIIFPPLAFLMILFKDNGWKEGWPVFKFALMDIYYQFKVSYYVNKLKPKNRKQDKGNRKNGKPRFTKREI